MQYHQNTVMLTEGRATCYSRISTNKSQSSIRPEVRVCSPPLPPSASHLLTHPSNIFVFLLPYQPVLPELPTNAVGFMPIMTNHDPVSLQLMVRITQAGGKINSYFIVLFCAHVIVAYCHSLPWQQI